MSLAIQDLPSDPDALRALAADLLARLAEKDLAIAARDAEIHAKTLHIEKLKAQLAVLRRARFGRSSERLDQAIEQLELLIGELEEGEALSQARGAATSSGAKPPRPPRAGGRQPLPGHLPRETVHHPAPCSCPSCGSTRLSVLGEDVSEVLEYVPSCFKVVRHVRPRVSCRACEAISQASMPSLPIERGRPGPAAPPTVAGRVRVGRHAGAAPAPDRTRRSRAASLLSARNCLSMLTSPPSGR